MNYQNNIWDIKDNLILRKDGSVFAIYQIPSKVINSVDGKTKEKHKDLVYTALSHLRNYHDFEIRMIPMDLNLYGRYKKLALDIDWDSEVGDLADYVLSKTIDHLETDIGQLYEYQYYILVPLKSLMISMDLKSVVYEGYRSSRNLVLNTFGIGETVPVNWAETYRNQKEVLENNLSLLNAKPLSTKENIFLHRLQFMRGQFYNKDAEITRVENSIENLDETNIEFEHVNIIKLNNMGETSYVAMLPINGLPENMSYIHLQEELQAIRFPVESDFKIQFSLPKGVFSLLGKAKRARQRLKNTISEAEEVEDVQKGSVIKSKFLLEDLQGKFDKDEPLVTYLHTLTITAFTLEELKAKYELLFATLNQLSIDVVRANADQVYLFYKNRMTETLDREDRNFLQSMSLKAFCENLFFMTKKIGTDIGFSIGRIDNQIDSWQGDYKKAIEASSTPVFTNLLQANKLGVKDKSTNNPHVAIIGETGTGKSFLTKLLFTYHSFLKTKILYIDPKAEMRKQYEKVLKEHQEKGDFKELQDYIQSINFITLDARDENNHGALDPLVFLKGQEARDLADSMIDTLLGKDNSLRIRNAYLKSLDKYLAKRERGEKVGMKQVFQDLMKHSDTSVQEAGDFLSTAVNQSILALCFSDGQNEGISVDSKITILEINGLNLPSDNRNVDLTSDEKKSLTIMYALGYYCTKFGKQDRTIETIEFFDEAWFFNSTTVGKQILKRMKRVGRSENNFLVFITQSVYDLSSEEDGTGFGSVFAFLEDTEIDAVLDYLKIPKTDTTKEWIGNMTMAQCIYLDTFGRKERITVDGMFLEITQLFNTVETKLQAV